MTIQLQAVPTDIGWHQYPFNQLGSGSLWLLPEKTNRIIK